MGDHQLASVTVREVSSSSPLALQFFVKAFPKGLNSQMTIVHQTKAYSKEVDILSSLFPEVKSALSGGGQGMEWTCKCLLTRPDVIVLEDLVLQGFRTPDVRGPITPKHILEAVSCLADLHAASLVYEEKQQPQPYRLGAVYPELLRETFYRHSPNHPGTQMQKAGIELLYALVERLRGADALEPIKDDLRRAMDVAYDLQKPSLRFRNVLCHGDLKRENIFFRYADGQPVEAKLIDFQMLRYAPPANDLNSLLYLSTDRAFRSRYYNDVIQHYYTRLRQNLQLYDLNIDHLLPWDTFQESCELYKMLGVTMATYYAPFSFFRPEHVAHVFSSSERFEHFFLRDRLPEALHAFDTDDFFRGVTTEIIDELIECVTNKMHLREYKRTVNCDF